MSSSNLEIITEQHVMEAVLKIENENLTLNPSTGYDVIINNKYYPPKEIIRISYKIATGNDVGKIYGGEQVNAPLRSLGFEIISKTSVWKMGCKWGSGAPSFYEFVKQESIVIGSADFSYKKGDLILITEGFTVYAIARVLSDMISITSAEEYTGACIHYKIDFEDWVTYAKAEWYQLPETEIFIYQLQQGIRRVRSMEIVERTIDIWENRDISNEDFIFYSKYSNQRNNLSWRYPSFVFIKDSWDDFGFKTSFNLVYFKTSKEKVSIGQIKILNRNSDNTELPAQFNKLDEAFCSLGQTIEYYRNLRSEFPDKYYEILKGLNDCAFFNLSNKRFQDDNRFKISLLRSSEAEYLLEAGAKMFDSKVRILKKIDFHFKYKIEEAISPHSVNFNFNLDNDLPNRFFCIVGKNGTGKTRFLAELANKLTDNNKPGDFSPERPAFLKIISASFSYFDKFKIPEKKDVSYEFIGVRNGKGLIQSKEMTNILWQSYQELSIDRNKKQVWLECIKKALETEYFDFDIDDLDSLSTKKIFIDAVDDIFSSGQKIVFQFITRLIASIELNSLIIFDEPETHLHPNIAGRLLRAIKEIIEKYDSFCILATHSPIIVQEIPSRFIRVFDRQENMPIIYQPSIECFGENLSTISNAIFQANEDIELYKQTFDKLLKNNSLQEINEIFDNKLSLNASLYIQSKSNENR